MNYLKLDKVVKEYKTEAGSFRALSDVSFELSNGEFVVIVGPSGQEKRLYLICLGVWIALQVAKLCLITRKYQI